MQRTRISHGTFGGGDQDSRRAPDFLGITANLPANLVQPVQVGQQALHRIAQNPCTSNIPEIHMWQRESQHLFAVDPIMIGIVPGRSGPRGTELTVPYRVELPALEVNLAFPKQGVDGVLERFGEAGEPPVERKPECFVVRPVPPGAQSHVKRPPLISSMFSAIFAVRAGFRNDVESTSGPNSIVLVDAARAASWVRLSQGPARLSGMGVQQVIPDPDRIESDIFSQPRHGQVLFPGCGVLDFGKLEADLSGPGSHHILWSTSGRER